MELECLKMAANRIIMPQDTKDRIINAVRQSCDVNQKQKVEHPTAIKFKAHRSKRP